MSDIAIQVEQLGKCYKLSQSKSGDLRESFTHWFSKLNGSSNGGLKSDNTTEFWALRDVNFKIERGEAVGIIGRNGAGKSTLLKILSRITEPTKGRFEINGRVSSLLEVGTGFHPELSGRENIYLNGTILGMKRQEVKAKFDEIVAFSGVERFIDTPVKHYSSGMKVRLAFSVAAHLEPEILIIDEVLAVGDAEFQKKCLGKMDEVSKQEGRTVLFVSHNMASMINLCTRGIFLKNGEVYHQASMHSVVESYLKDNATTTSMININEREDRKGSQIVRFTGVRFLDANFNDVNALVNGRKIIIELNFERRILDDLLSKVHFSIGINDNMGNRVLLLSTDLTQQTFGMIPSSINKVYVEIPKLQLKSGVYSFTLNMSIAGETTDWVPNAGIFEVENGDFFNTGVSLPDGQGSFLVDHNFYIR